MGSSIIEEFFGCRLFGIKTQKMKAKIIATDLNEVNKNDKSRRRCVYQIETAILRAQTSKPAMINGVSYFDRSLHSIHLSSWLTARVSVSLLTCL